MKIAVLSDSHDNLWKLEAASEAIRSAEVVIHCGDLCSPFMVRRLAEIAGDRPTHVVWGNNDGDQFLIGQVASGFPRVVLHGPLAEIELAGRRVAVTHYPQIAIGLSRSGMYDLVCHGHDHVRSDLREGPCLRLNPGELMGMKGMSTLALVETSDLSVQFVEV